MGSQVYTPVKLIYSQVREIPKDWKVVFVKDVCKLVNGSGFPLEHQKITTEEIPFIKVSDMNLACNDKYIRKTNNTISTTTLQLINANLCPEKTLIFPKIGATISTNKRRLLSKPSCFDNNIMGLIPTNIEHMFLYYLFQQIRLENFAQTTALPYIDNDIIGNMKIQICEREEQRRIAINLSKVDELIQKTDQVIEQTQKIKKGLVQILLTEGIGHSRFKKTSIGEIPEEWELVLSRNLFSFVTSGSRDWAKYYSKSGPIMIRITNLDHETIYPDFTSIQRVTLPVGIEGVRTRVKLNDILVSITADVGMVAVISNPVPEAYVNQHIALIRPIEGINSKYIARYLSWHGGGLKQFKQIQRGVTKVGLGLEDIKSIWIPLPCETEQHKIISVLDSVELNVSKNYQYRYKLKDLKKGLMQKLLTGKIRVKV